MLASWCIIRFLWKWGVLAMPMYHDMEKYGLDSRFTHNTTYISHNYKTIFFVELGNHTHQYMLEPILFFAIRTIASMRLSSHALSYEMGHWGTRWEWSTMHSFPEASSGVWVSHFDTMPFCLWSYSIMISTHLRPNPILAWISLTITMCTLDCNIHW